MKDRKNVLIVTNNPKVYDKYGELFNIHKIDELSYIEVLYKSRDLVHKGYKLLTHPMAGSMKPNQTPYRSVMLEKTPDKIMDYASLKLIENAIEATNKFLNDRLTPDWNEDILTDFQTVDSSFMEGAINNSMLI